MPRLRIASLYPLVVAGLLWSTASWPQDSAPPASTPATEPVALNLERADITELVRWVAKLTGRNIILHPDVKGEVTVVAGESLTPEEAYRVFLAVLQVHGLAVRETPQALEVVPAERLNASGAPLTDENSKVPHAEDVVVRVVRIRHVEASDVAASLKPLVSEGALLAAYPDSNLLLVSDRSANIERLLGLIARIDQDTSIEAEVISLQYADAQELFGTLQSLMPPDRKSNIGAHFVAERRSNSILLSGDPAARRPLRALIERLDQPLPSEGDTQVVAVNYADAASLVPILQRFATGAPQGKEATFLSTDTRIEAHADTNSLVITAPPELMATLHGVIRELDVRRAQVVVEAIIVEVNRDGLRDLGVQWLSEVPKNGVFGAIGLLPVLPTPAPPGVGPGLTIGAFDDGTLRGLVRALESDANANLLSTPTVVTLDNEEAEILVGENVPFITGSSTSASSGTDNPFQTIQRHDIGVTLKVKPHVNTDNSVTLAIVQTVEAVTDSAADAADIVTSKRSISTKVLIEDDRTLVLGGLIRDDLTEKVSKVPLLGSLPLIGRAFRSTSNQVVKKNLMVFIHPRVLRSPEDSALETHMRYNRLRSLQQEQRENVDRFLIPGRHVPELPELPPSEVPDATVPAESPESTP